jgi:hypothetical protein
MAGNCQIAKNSEGVGCRVWGVGKPRLKLWDCIMVAVFLARRVSKHIFFSGVGFEPILSMIPPKHTPYPLHPILVKWVRECFSYVI